MPWYPTFCQFEVAALHTGWHPRWWGGAARSTWRPTWRGPCTPSPECLLIVYLLMPATFSACSVSWCTRPHSLHPPPWPHHHLFMWKILAVDQGGTPAVLWPCTVESAGWEVVGRRRVSGASVSSEVLVARRRRA
jgi:hypothetical protein